MSNNNTPLAANSTANEHKTILDLLNTNGSVTTTDLRNHGILSPAQRIKELRGQGYEIKTDRTTTVDHAGVKHVRVASYSLVGGAV